MSAMRGFARVALAPERDTTRTLRQCVYHGVLWAIAITAISAPFAVASGFVALVAIVLFVLVYLLSRLSRRPFRLLRYSAREFALVLFSTVIFLWLAASLLFVVLLLLVS